MNRIVRIFALLTLFVLIALPVGAQDATATTEPAGTSEATDTPTEAATDSATPVPATPAPTEEPTPTFLVTAPDVSAVDSLVFVAFVHTGTDTGPVDFYVSGLGTTPLVANLAFGEATEVFALPAGSHTVSIRTAGSDAASDPLTSFTWDFTGNSTWIISAVGLQSTLSFLGEPVTIIRTPLNGLARVRVVNWVADAQNLTVTGGSSDADFGSGLAWSGIQDAEVEPGTYELQVTDGADVNFTEAAPFDFEADTVYTLFLIGSTNGTPALSILAVAIPQDETRVRFVSERSDTVDILMRPDIGVVSGSVEAGATTDWFVIPSTSATFIAYAPGTGPTGQELASVATQLRPARDVTVTLHSDGTATVTDESLTPEED